MPVTGPIADRARSELPDTWALLAKADSGYGEGLLQEQINTVMNQLFGVLLDDNEQAALDDLVLDYAGKSVALRLINPAIDTWSHMPTAISATGRSETKGWGDRAAYFKELRKQLLEQTRLMWEDVEPLLPNRRVRRAASIPVVALGSGFMTPDPEDFEPAYGTRTDPTPWRPDR